MATDAVADENRAHEPHAGPYVGLFGGYRFSGSFTDVDWRFSGLSGTGDNIKYDGGFLGGVKLGSWFNQYLGAQIEGWYSRVKTPSQDWTIRTSGFSATTALEAGRQDTYTGAFNLMARLPVGVIEPYLGVGVALLHMPGSGFDNPTPGLNVLAGLQVHLAERVAAFGEFKYSRFRQDGSEDGVEVTWTYQPMAVVAGLSFEFGGR